MSSEYPLLPTELAVAYRVIDQIGVGGHASVFRAARRDDVTSRVAIKVLHEPVTDRLLHRRFQRECHALTRLDGEPTVMRLLDAGISANGRAYLVSPLYAGTFADRIASIGPLGASETIETGRGIATGLGAAHRAGVLHRDVKPSNVFVGDDGQPVLGDFGAAGVVGAHTLSSSLSVSIAYTAPETLETGETSERSDLYSLGVTLYQMLTAQLPFDSLSGAANEAGGIGALVRRVSNEAPRAIDARSAPGSLITLIMQLLEKNPDDRPHTADDVVARLELVDSTAHIPTHVDPRRRRVFAAAAAASLAVVGTMVLRDQASGPDSATGRIEQWSTATDQPSDLTLRTDGAADANLVVSVNGDADDSGRVLPRVDDLDSMAATTSTTVASNGDAAASTTAAPGSTTAIGNAVDDPPGNDGGTTTPGDERPPTEPSATVAASPPTAAPAPVPSPSPSPTVAAPAPTMPATTTTTTTTTTVPAPPTSTAPTPPTTVLAVIEERCGDAPLVCEGFESGVDGWNTKIRAEAAVVSTTSAGAAIGSSSLQITPSSGADPGGGWVEQQVSLPAATESTHIRFRIRVANDAKPGGQGVPLLLKDQNNRDWMVGIVADGDGTVSFTMDSSIQGRDDLDIAGNASNSFSTDIWHCVQFDITPNGLNPATLRIDGNEVKKFSPTSAELTMRTFFIGAGMLNMRVPDNTPSVQIDDLVVQADSRPSC